MSEVLKFKLESRLAIIRKPESNDRYFTYNNIHKIAILGILGSIIGENGYNYNLLMNKEYELPEFYQNLKDIKIGIEPITNKGIFNKKWQKFNNSVGYASKEEGNNLIVNEELLENPKWNIYVLSNSSDKYEKIKEYMLNSKCEYIPYIGKNEHFGSISDVKIYNNVSKISKVTDKIDSIYLDDIKSKVIDKNYLDILNSNDNEKEFIYAEIMPMRLNEKIGYIDFKKFCFTNKNIEISDQDEIYHVDNKNIFFF